MKYLNKKVSRMRRALKTRCKLKSLQLIRLVVHRTSRHIYAQIIDRDNFTVLASASTLEKSIKKNISCYSGNKEAAGFIGSIIAQRALKKGVTHVSFDRSGFKYHGRVRILAECARKSGLKF